MWMSLAPSAIAFLNISFISVAPLEIRDQLKE
ncbi:uncharacterized protein METZ01_LOCUS39782 [marine metagenome]|uniref:Uncharacterized protein n=1 Tax=marine metagenome TaxID=408172 RepID=A0A381R7R1_9ZZZZ